MRNRKIPWKYWNPWKAIHVIPFSLKTTQKRNKTTRTTSAMFPGCFEFEGVCLCVCCVSDGLHHWDQDHRWCSAFSDSYWRGLAHSGEGQSGRLRFQIVFQNSLCTFLSLYSSGSLALIHMLPTPKHNCESRLYNASSTMQELCK